MKKLHLSILTMLLTSSFALPVAAAEHPEHQEGGKHVRVPSPEGARVYIVRPRDGATVRGKFKVIFGLTGMGVCPVGLTAAGGQPLPNTGHHHLLVDFAKLPPLDVPLVSDKPTAVMHFGGGQTEVMLALPPGKHTLQLVLGDYAHVAHDPPVISEKITVTVSE